MARHNSSWPPGTFDPLVESQPLTGLDGKILQRNRGKGAGERAGPPQFETGWTFEELEQQAAHLIEARVVERLRGAHAHVPARVHNAQGQLSRPLLARPGSLRKEELTTLKETAEALGIQAPAALTPDVSRFVANLTKKFHRLGQMQDIATNELVEVFRDMVATEPQADTVAEGVATFEGLIQSLMAYHRQVLHMLTAEATDAFIKKGIFGGNREQSLMFSTGAYIASHQEGTELDAIRDQLNPRAKRARMDTNPSGGPGQSPQRGGSKGRGRGKGRNRGGYHNSWSTPPPLDASAGHHHQRPNTARPTDGGYNANPHHSSNPQGRGRGSSGRGWRDSRGRGGRGRGSRP